MLMYLRKYNARERKNILATGGGPRDVTEEKMPFEVTGSILELSNALGVSITGLDGFGSDTASLSTGDTSSKVSTATSDGAQSLEVPSADTTYTFDDTMHDHWESLLHEDAALTGEKAESVPIFGETQDSRVSLLEATSQTETPSMSTTPFPGRSQFFQTSSQRRSTKRPASSTVVSASSEGCASNLVESRMAYILERERRASEKHAAEMQYEKALMEAKLEEMRENTRDRQAERERRAEIHAMTIRHREVLFARQNELLIAARDVLTRSSSEIAVGSILSLAMNQAGVSIVDATVNEVEAGDQFQSNENVGHENVGNENN